MTKKGWDVPSERPEVNPQVLRNASVRDNSRSEQIQNRHNDDQTNRNAYDMVTGEKESPIPVPEVLTGRIPSRSHLNQSYDDINLDTTIPAQERILLGCRSRNPDTVTGGSLRQQMINLYRIYCCRKNIHTFFTLLLWTTAAVL